MKRVVLLLVIGIALIAWLPQTPAMADEIVWEYSTGLDGPSDADRLPNGNTLISDRWHSRVIEVTPDGTIVWEYSESGYLALYLVGNAERLPNGNTLIVDMYSGYPFNTWDRVFEVEPDGNIVWSMRAYPIQCPYSAQRLSNGNTLITVDMTDKVIEVTPHNTIVWEYSIGLDGPFNADRLPNGNTLITDGHNNRVIEVTPDGTMVWLYSALGLPIEADRLPNGNTLICDNLNARVIEVTPDYNIVWEYGGIWPGEADRLPYGNTLICDGLNNRIIEVGLPFAGTVSVPDTTYGVAGDTVTIPVNREDVMGVGVLSAEFDLIYDSGILTGIDVDTSGTLLSGTDWTCQYNVVGDTFSVYMAGTDTLYGSGTLINLLFVVSPDAQPEEESPLHFDNFMFNQGTTAVITRDGVFIVREVLGAIEGTVTDAATGAPIDGAIVTAQSTHPSCDTTDVNGQYLMLDVWPDTYNMTVTMFGYNQFDTTGIVVFPGETTEINFAMLHPEIVVEPASFDVELPVGTTYDALMTISNPGNGPLDFDISIGSSSRLIKSIELTPETTIVKEVTSDTKIDNFYSNFTESPISERPVIESEPYYQPSTINHQPSTINHQPSTINHQLSYRPTGEDTIHYDGEPTGAIGLTNGGTFEAAIRLTPEELGPYDGWELISALFYHWESGMHSGQIKIYGAGSSSEPGVLITSEPYSVTGQSWLRTDLAEPVTIDATQDLWTSVEITHNAGQYPIGHDAGPAVQGKGDFVYDSGAGWQELYLLGLNYNWNIRAIVSQKWLSVTPNSGTVPADQSLDITVHFDTYGLTPDSTYTTNIMIYNNIIDSLVTIPVTMHTGPVGVEDDTPQVPKVFALGQNYPNPFSASTTISFNIHRRDAKDALQKDGGQAEIKIYNVKGQLVKTFRIPNPESQIPNIVWDGKDEKGKSLPSGIYLYRITAGDFTDTKKCVILR